jgi:metal-responsive CopG/Arc/MetJ family transcriptional regulator
MPIVSFSINKNLLEFIDKLISKNQYDNKSKIIRDALLRLMSTMDVASIDSFADLSPIDKKVIGNMIIVIQNDPLIQRKLNKIENNYKEQIISKNQHFQGENIIIFLIVEAKIDELQNFVVEVNGVEEIKNFRYLIIN